MTDRRMKTHERITEIDGKILGFLSKFPGADAEAISYLQQPATNNFGFATSGLTTVASIQKRLQKLSRLGAVQRFRNPATGEIHYGITDFGHEAAIHYGYDYHGTRGIDGLSVSRLDHHRKIALVAAQMVAPTGIFKESLGIDPVSIDQVVSENQMRFAYEAARKTLTEQRNAGKGTGDYQSYRQKQLKNGTTEIQAGLLEVGGMGGEYPELLTVATPKTDSGSRKTLHQPDLAVLLDTDLRTTKSPEAKNLLVEIELSAKRVPEYETILRTFKYELSTKAVYGKIVYFVGTTAIKNALTRADQNAQTNLIGRGDLVILPIKGRDGREIKGKPKVPRPENIQAPKIEKDLGLFDADDE